MAKTKSLLGLLFIGDPHVEGRCPDFRSDDYPNAIIDKIEWCLNYAKSNNLLPVFLGDLFDKPRDNPTWMLARLIEILRDHQSIGIYGNHDCAEPVLNENDSLTILLKSGSIQLISAENPWKGEIFGRPTVIGGSSYRERIPDCIPASQFRTDSLFPDKPFGVWLTHHDVLIDGYDGGRFAPFEIGNVDLLVNGHIHTRSEPIKKGQTLWTTPGNISRRSRSDKFRMQLPAVLQVVLDNESYSMEYVVVPHEEFDSVFHEPVTDEIDDGASAFVAGLNELRIRKTSSGAGLKEFLRKNLEQFTRPVADEIMTLANQVTGESAEGEING